jgi:serine/threonine protein kinase/WD40 repeat protein
MSREAAPRDVLDIVGEDFVARYRRGERPAASEYAARYPEIADHVQELLEALVLMEQCAGAFTGPPGGEKAALLPRQVGDYRLVREVGRGGMGVVYEAEQISLGRRVALKVLPPHALLDASQVRRFRREAMAAARLHHTNIVPVFGIGEAEGVHYYVMQFIDGHGLDVVLREANRRRAASKTAVTGATPPAPLPDAGSATLPSRPFVPGREEQQQQLSNGSIPGSDGTGCFPLDSTSAASYFLEVGRLGAQTADALAYAHGQGVLHRDIKPSNLLLDGQGTVWVSDFGLAKADDAENLTRTGDVIGTLRYMPPERFAGRSDPRGDVYSLGATLYELATGRPVFDETDRGRLIQQILLQKPIRPCRLEPRIPRDLETIILKAIAKEPERRYPSAAELAEDLRHFVGHRPIQARRVPPWEQTWYWCRRNPLIATLAAAVGLLLLVIAIGAALAAWRLGGQLQETRQAEHRAQQRLFESLTAQTRLSRGSGRVGQRFDSLAALAEAIQLLPKLQTNSEVTMQLRNEVISSLALPDVRPIRAWEAFPAGSGGAFTVDANFEHYARADLDGNISIRRIADDSEAVLLPGFGNSITILQFHPSGDSLIVRYADPPGRPGFLSMWDWRRGAETYRLEMGPQANALSLSGDGRRLAIGHADQTIRVHDAGTGAELARIAAGKRALEISLSFDGSLIAVGYGATETELRAALSGEVIHKLSHPQPARRSAWHPGGKLLAVACDDSQVYVWSLATRQPHEVLKVDHIPYLLSFDPGGGVLVTAAWDGTIRLWNPWTGKPLVRLPGIAAYLSRDGTRLFSRDGNRGCVWEFVPGREFRALAGQEVLTQAKAPVVYVSTDPGGQWLAVGGTGGAGVGVWDLPKEEFVSLLPHKTIYDIVFDPHGRALNLTTPSGVVSYPLVGSARSSAVIGPAESLLEGKHAGLAFDPEGKHFVVSGRLGPQWRDRQKPSDGRPIDHRSGRYFAFSPDGKWLASGAHHGAGVKIWDRDGRLVRELVPQEDVVSVSFSPDGKWLVTDAPREFIFWETDTWREVRRISRPSGTARAVSWNGLGDIVALAVATNRVQLQEAATGRPLADFVAPDESRVHQHALSPGADKLIVLCGQPTQVRVWDIALIRKHLSAMSLDWDGGESNVQTASSAD